MDVTNTEREAWWRKPGMVLAAAAAALTLAWTPGCDEKGPAEEAGEAVDEAAENTADAIEDAAD